MMTFPWTTLRPAPTHADQPLALTDALGDGFGRGAHWAVAFEVGLVFGAEALDDFLAGGGVARVMENERIAEDAVSAVDVDGNFAGAGLAGAPARLLPRRMEPGVFMGERSLKSARRVASPYRLPGGELGVRGGQDRTGIHRLTRRAGGADFVEPT